MKLLLEQVKIVDPRSKYNNQIKDIVFLDGVIKSIQDQAVNNKDSYDRIISKNNLSISLGWVDCFADFCDPGFEFKEDIETGSLAAMAGGYTSVCIVPNTMPSLQNKTQIDYIKNRSQHLPITIYPIGSISKNELGQELAEMYDLYDHGTIAFSDGWHPLNNSGLLLKALLYIKRFNGTLIQVPIEESISKYGLINEGVVSTKLRLLGIPTVSEEIAVKRDLDLLKYTNSRLHFSGVSSPHAIDSIYQAKKEGYSVTCSVTPYHLLYCDEDIVNYDTFFKVNPPLRSKQDMLALRTAVLAGKIDCIASHHRPQNYDSKICDFASANWGMITLQTAFAMVQDALPTITSNQIAELFTYNSRKIFNIPTATIEEKQCVEITIFSETDTTELTVANNKSKSANTPCYNRHLRGKVIGIYAKNKLIIN
ncbi:MAG: dihydroorotase [Phycisphaerales bacterium]|nr:dihydroorotase [Phycisphaerales bacterium]